MNSIIKKELKKIFNSLEGYIIAIVFLLTNGLALWVLPYPAPNIFEGGFASLDEFFKLNSLILLFLTPFNRTQSSIMSIMDIPNFKTSSFTS